MSVQKSVLRDKALQSRDAIELLADKWRIAILHLLRAGPLRTHQLQGALQEVSPKMLTQTLRGMERDGLLHRTAFRVAPARVEYELSSLGLSLIEPLQRLCHWAQAHITERDAARARFDLAAQRGRAKFRGTKKANDCTGKTQTGGD